MPESTPNSEVGIDKIESAIETGLQHEREGNIEGAFHFMEEALALAIHSKYSTREIIDQIRDHKDRLEELLFPPQPGSQIEY